MIIRTNLCSKAPRQERAPIQPRQWIVASLALVLALGVFNWMAKDRGAKKLLAVVTARKAKQLSLEDELALAQSRSEKRTIKINRRNSIIGFAKNRLNWAPLLEQIFSALPENIELSALSGTCTGLDSCLITITGQAAARQPRLECDKFRLLLTNNLTDMSTSIKTRFIQLEDSEETIVLDKVPYSVSDFTIALEWSHPGHGN